ncbi:hypothetical protein AVEN_211318-1 [Araneus ventricosus]|uniref:Uncharacterized protein n=1 Tax=Araneus ventricosus TaxID=182803 RepID=A0A4Y2WZB5_ARAVE|nr:hypothetical protein AVEN_211318-1 [Araneus ventricosus]
MKVLKTALTRLRDKVASAIKDADSVALRLFKSKTSDLFNDFKLLFDSIFVTCKPEELDDFIKEKETIDKLKLNVNHKMNKTDPEHSISSVSSCNASVLSEVKLPTLSVPTFNGKIENWIMFKDMFVASVIENKSISNSMKLQYLKASCRDEALRVIQSISISDANFDIAWKFLEDRLSCYEDVLKRSFLSSDPVLTGMRPSMRKRSKSFLKETLEMLLPMEFSEVLDEEDSDHEETDNDINDLSSDE